MNHVHLLFSSTIHNYVYCIKKKLLRLFLLEKM